MAIDVGDAVLSILVDQSQANAQLAQFGGTVTKQMAPAATAVKGTSDAVGEMTGRMAVGAMGAQQLGEVATLSGEKARFSMYEARGEAGLLGEMFGIHLPRHVRSFLAELPGVGEALSGAFAATAIIFLIEALVKGIEKIQHWAEQGERVAAAWQKYDQTIFESSQHMQKEIDKQEEKLIEMAQGPVAALEFALKHLESTAFQTFSLITKDIDAALKAMREEAGFGNVFGDAAKDLEKFKLGLETTARLAAQAHPENPFAPYLAMINQATLKEGELQKTIEQRQAASGKDPSAAVDGLIKERQAVLDMIPVLDQGIKLERERQEVIKSQIAEKAADEEAKAAKLRLDLQIAQINLWKEQQRSAYENVNHSVATWGLAEQKAIDDTTKAHEEYQQKLVGIYGHAAQTVRGLLEEEEKVSGATEDAGKKMELASISGKAYAAAQELAKLKTQDQTKELQRLNDALDKQRERGEKLRDEWLHLQEAGITKEFEKLTEATKKLAQADVELEKAQSKVDQAKFTEGYKLQEQAITELARFHVITEQDKAQKLALLYRAEEQSALDAMRDERNRIALESAGGNILFGPKELSDLKKNLELAQGDFTQSVAAIKASFGQIQKGNPLLTEAQIKDLQAQLARVLAAYTGTEAEIIKREQNTDKQILGSKKNFYEQSIALAVALVQASESPQLRLNQAKLAEMDIDIRLAQLRGIDTAQLEKNRAALAQDTNALRQQEAAKKQSLVSSLQLHQAKLAALRDEIELTKARHGDTTALKAQEKEEQKATGSLLKEVAAMRALHDASAKHLSTRANWDGFFNDLASGALKTGEAFRRLGEEVVASFAESLEAALSGSEGFAVAMEKMLKSALASLAAHALVKVAEEIAYAASDLANPLMAWHAGFHFAAAAKWAAVGSVAGIGAALLPGGNSSSSSSAPSGTPAPAAGSPALTAGSAPTQTVNVPHLSSGGLVMQETLAVVHGGEAVVPLSNHQAMQALVGSLAAQINAVGSGSHEIAIQIHTDIPGFARVLNHHVKRGSVRIIASDSIRNTRRS